jgi:hypothetical protein
MCGVDNCGGLCGRCDVQSTCVTPAFECVTSAVYTQASAETAYMPVDMTSKKKQTLSLGLKDKSQGVAFSLSLYPSIFFQTSQPETTSAFSLAAQQVPAGVVVSRTEVPPRNGTISSWMPSLAVEVRVISSSRRRTSLAASTLPSRTPEASASPDLSTPTASAEPTGGLQRQEELYTVLDLYVTVGDGKGLDNLCVARLSDSGSWVCIDRTPMYIRDSFGVLSRVRGYIQGRLSGVWAVIVQPDRVTTGPAGVSTTEVFFVSRSNWAIWVIGAIGLVAITAVSSALFLYFKKRAPILADEAEPLKKAHRARQGGARNGVNSGSGPEEANDHLALRPAGVTAITRDMGVSAVSLDPYYPSGAAPEGSSPGLVGRARAAGGMVGSVLAGGAGETEGVAVGTTTAMQTSGIAQAVHRRNQSLNWTGTFNHTPTGFQTDLTTDIDSDNVSSGPVSSFDADDLPPFSPALPVNNPATANLNNSTHNSNSTVASSSAISKSNPRSILETATANPADLILTNINVGEDVDPQFQEGILSILGMITSPTPMSTSLPHQPRTSAADVFPAPTKM